MKFSQIFTLNLHKQGDPIMYEAIHATIEGAQVTTPIELHLSATLSIAHLTEEDEKQLAQLSEGGNHTHIMKRENGFCIKLCTLDKDEIKTENKADIKVNFHKGFSDNFNHIMSYCTVNRISLIEFDSDAPMSNLFETFEW